MGGKKHLAHSQKQFKKVKEMIKVVDVVLELVDARAPRSSKNTYLSGSGFSRGHALILHKSDLADKKITRGWVDYYQENGFKVFSFSSLFSTAELFSFLQEYRASSKFARFNRPLRLMVAGMPNVGKSTLVNLLLKKKATPTGDRPGITRGSQWVRIQPGLEMLDTPGVLQPEVEEEFSYQCLAAIGILPPKRYDPVETASWLIEIMKDYGCLGGLSTRYRLEAGEERLPEHMLEEIGRARGCLVSGGEVDFTEASGVLLKDFREGRLGKISLERPVEPGTD